MLLEPDLERTKMSKEKEQLTKSNTSKRTDHCMKNSAPLLNLKAMKAIKAAIMKAPSTRRTPSTRVFFTQCTPFGGCAWFRKVTHLVVANLIRHVSGYCVGAIRSSGRVTRKLFKDNLRDFSTEAES